MRREQVKCYTLTEAADCFSVREDDLIVLLPDTAIGLDWPVSGFTQADIELLGRLIRTIRQLYAESAYGGGDI